MSQGSCHSAQFIHRGDGSSALRPASSKSKSVSWQRRWLTAGWKQAAASTLCNAPSSHAHHRRSPGHPGPHKLSQRPPERNREFSGAAKDAYASRQAGTSSKRLMTPSRRPSRMEAACGNSASLNVLLRYCWCNSFGSRLCGRRWRTTCMMRPGAAGTSS